MEKEGTSGWELAKKTLTEQETRHPLLSEALAYAVAIPDFFRPAIVSLCCKAVNGKAETTIPSGASLILLSKAIGIHDDIIDHTKVRKRRRTLFGRFGEEIALITSDILLFKGFTLMRKNTEVGVDQQASGRILDTIDRFWFGQGESEILELKSRRQTSTTPAECLEKIRMRASELDATARIGGILGDGTEIEIEALGNYGRLLGTASILRDEIIDMLEPDVLRHRIKHESLPLPLIYALQHAEARSKITSVLLKKKLQNKDMLETSKITDDIGGIDHSAQKIAEMVQKACLNANVLPKKREELVTIANSLVMYSTEWKLMLQSR
jgi:geranylgeranyl pyrophosphate synthase